MKNHSIIVRLGQNDTATIRPIRVGTHITEINFFDGFSRLRFGLGQALDELRELGLRPSETAIDLVLLAAAITAADTRISRSADAQDGWTRLIDLHLPVQDPSCWTGVVPLLTTTLNFLTGDRWSVYFRPRATGTSALAPTRIKLRMVNPTSVCLFSGGLDSFIGAINLLVDGQVPMLVSHYSEGITSKHQDYCADVIKRKFVHAAIHHMKIWVRFPADTVEGKSENTLRGRSFLFFALAAMVADAVGGDVTIHVPENGFISLNVPLDPSRLGALSTRTTHPFYMARFDELLNRLGINASLYNRYSFLTKGQMIETCADPAFLRQEVRHTMSCSSPGSRRYDPDPTQRAPKHCGRCVPCLIRRAAIQKAWGVDDTPYRIPDLRAQVLDTNKAEGENIRSFQLMLSRLSRQPDRARFDIHRPGPLVDHPDRLSDYEAVYVAGLQEVGRMLQGVRAQPL